MPEPPVNRVRRLSYSALALFELCSYRFYVERFAGLRETRPMLGESDREPGLAATEIGDVGARDPRGARARGPAAAGGHVRCST